MLRMRSLRRIAQTLELAAVVGDQRARRNLSVHFMHEANHVHAVLASGIGELALEVAASVRERKLHAAPAPERFDERPTEDIVDKVAGERCVLGVAMRCHRGSSRLLGCTRNDKPSRWVRQGVSNAGRVGRVDSRARDFGRVAPPFDSYLPRSRNLAFRLARWTAATLR